MIAADHTHRVFHNYAYTASMPIDNSRRDIKVRVYKCDICNDKIECNDDIESYIDMKNDINDSYESEYDKQEPKLLLCLFCQEEFNIPSWV